MNCYPIGGKYTSSGLGKDIRLNPAIVADDN